MMRSRIAAVLCLGASLAGCMVGPQPTSRRMEWPSAADDPDAPQARPPADPFPARPSAAHDLSRYFPGLQRVPGYVPDLGAEPRMNGSEAATSESTGPRPIEPGASGVAVRRESRPRVRTEEGFADEGRLRDTPPRWRQPIEPGVDRASAEVLEDQGRIPRLPEAIVVEVDPRWRVRSVAPREPAARPMIARPETAAGAIRVGMAAEAPQPAPPSAVSSSESLAPRRSEPAHVPPDPFADWAEPADSAGSAARADSKGLAVAREPDPVLAEAVAGSIPTPREPALPVPDQAGVEAVATAEPVAPAPVDGPARAAGVPGPPSAIGVSGEMAATPERVRAAGAERPDKGLRQRESGASGLIPTESAEPGPAWSEGITRAAASAATDAAAPVAARALNLDAELGADPAIQAVAAPRTLETPAIGPTEPVGGTALEATSDVAADSAPVEASFSRTEKSVAEAARNAQGIQDLNVLIREVERETRPSAPGGSEPEPAEALPAELTYQFSTEATGPILSMPEPPELTAMTMVDRTGQSAANTTPAAVPGSVGPDRSGAVPPGMAEATARVAPGRVEGGEPGVSVVASEGAPALGSPVQASPRRRWALPAITLPRMPRFGMRTSWRDGVHASAPPPQFPPTYYEVRPGPGTLVPPPAEPSPPVSGPAEAGEILASRPSALHVHRQPRVSELATPPTHVLEHAHRPLRGPEPASAPPRAAERGPWWRPRILDRLGARP